MTWYQPRTPDKMQLIPWLHQDVIDYLASIITPDMDIIEQGCGGSTVWMAQRARSVIAFDNAPEWVHMVKYHLTQNKLDDIAQVILWPLSDKLPPMPYMYDMALVDGLRDARRLWIDGVRGIVKRHGWFVLDNANRPEYQDVRITLQKVAKLETYLDRNENGTRYLVTEFWRLN